MREIITVAEMVISGRMESGRYVDPYVKIIGPAGDALTIELDELRGDVVLEVPYRYREATGYLDIPLFRVTVHADDGEALDSIQSGYLPSGNAPGARDIYAAWTYYDYSFRFRIPPDAIPTGSAAPRGLRFVLEASLRRYKWPSAEVMKRMGDAYPYTYLDQLEEVPPILRAEQTISVTLKTASVSEVCIAAQWPWPLGAPIPISGIQKDYPDDVVETVQPIRHPVYGRLYVSDPRYPRWGSPASAPYRSMVEMVQDRDRNTTAQLGHRTEYGMEPAEIAVDWKTEGYFMNFEIRNFGLREIIGWKIVIEEQEVSEGTGDGVSTPPKWEFDETGSIAQGCSLLYSWLRDNPPVIKSWSWVEIHDPSYWDVTETWGGAEAYYTLHDTEKLFRYRATSLQIEFRTADGAGNTKLQMPVPEQWVDGVVRVTVPASRIRTVREYGVSECVEDNISLGLTVLSIVVAILKIPKLAALIGGAAGLARVLEPVAKAGKWLSDATSGKNDKLVQAALDPLEYDPDFVQIPDYQTLLAETTIAEIAPQLLSAYGDHIRSVVAYGSAISIGFRRFMSSLAAGHQGAAARQRQAAEIHYELLQDAIFGAKTALRAAEPEIAKPPSDEEMKTMDELIEYVRANGMPEEVRIDLTQKGYNDSQLEVIRERILEYRHQDLVESQVSEAQRLMLWAMDVQSASLTSVRDMMRMDALSDRDRIAELYRNRLIDETEMQRRMAAADPERSMPVAQLQFISGYHRGLLVRNGLLNSKHVLDRAKTRATRRSLAKQVGVDALLVLEWANRADLLRIGGLSQAHADLLENVGVDTVVELTNRNARNLFQAISDHYDAAGVVGSVSLRDVEGWIGAARQLERRIAY